MLATSRVQMELTMHADELRMAVTHIVDILEKSGIRHAIDQYRSAKGDKRLAAAARLGHAGAVIMERVDSLSNNERQVLSCLHLDSLGSAAYWQDLLGGEQEPQQHQASIVRLASRVMFASSHLPAMVSLLAKSSQPATENSALEAGEGRLHIRLTDAGERASDPDRVARAIDGIDMLYSACASIARKPAMDLRLDAVHSRKNRDRDIVFTGERDSVAAVFAVIDSIPAALSDIDPEQDIDLDAVVKSLPIFADLNTLASLGTFSRKDLKDISETMHQGALLTLESGVILVDDVTSPKDPDPSDRVRGGSVQAKEQIAAPEKEALRSQAAALPVGTTGTGFQLPETATSDSQSQVDISAAERDEHYNRYLREREAMLRKQPTGSAATINGHSPSGDREVTAVHAGDEDRSRREAVEQLLKSLEQARRS